MDEICGNHNLESSKQVDEDDVLPGFRFYPTDEELADFYLRRKVEKKPISIELIKEIDIYKYDPWDLHKVCSTVGDNELYFYCQRGRKYKNSVRPNRVTGSGFWKATGIDKPIYANTGGRDGEGSQGRVVGLKKSLVYYRGSAGRGTKTDWMMHEFRLPLELPSSVITVQEAEVWTLCRIFKRSLPNKKYTANWIEISTKSRNHPTESTFGSSPNDHMLRSMSRSSEDSYYISFKPQTAISWTDKTPLVGNLDGTAPFTFRVGQSSSVSHSAPYTASSSSTSSFSYPGGYSNNNNHFFTNDQHNSWDELRPVMDQFASDASPPPP